MRKRETKERDETRGEVRERKRFEREINNRGKKTRKR
jgi:hypothetical protein